MGMVRSTYYDRPEKAADDTAIVEAMFAVCDDFEAYGYRRVGAALRQQGLVVNHKDSPALRCHHRQRSRRSDLPEPGQGLRSERPEPALGLRHHLCRAAGSLRLRRRHSRCLVTPDRRLRHRPIHRCAPDDHSIEGCNRAASVTARLHPPFRSRLAICRRALSRDAEPQRPDRLDGTPGQPL